MANKAIIFTAFICLYATACDCTQSEENASSLMKDQKRILLTDPNYVQQQLLKLQSELQHLQTEIASERAKNDIQDNSIQHLANVLNTGAGQGAVYIRWARTTCGDNRTERVYAGYAGGSSFTLVSGAANTVCLPPDPTWGPHKDDLEGDPSYMYGAELDTSNIFGPGSYDEDVPCAVCRSTVHTASIMIPGRINCYDGWTEAYHGILVATCSASVCKSASEYICLDSSPEYVAGGAANQNGRVFHAVYTVCGSLKCPPYENHKIMSCVVCTK